MPNMKVVIEVEQEAWDAIPRVARYLELPSDAQTAKVASEIFEQLILEKDIDAKFAFGESVIGHGANNDALQTLNEILDPSISRDVVVTKIQDVMATGKTTGEWFEEYSADPDDLWIRNILAISENQLFWKLALVSVYQVIKDPTERRATTTWQLIEKTYHLMQKNVDNSPPTGDNGAVPSGTSQSQNPKEN